MVFDLPRVGFELIDPAKSQDRFRMRKIDVADEVTRQV
jgi:hypothetical protein